MARFLKKSEKRMGKPPGTIIFVGKQRIDEPRIRIIDYDQSTISDEFIDKNALSQLATLKARATTSWVNIDGLHDTALLKSIADALEIPPLMMEDIANTGQRPKIEILDDIIFISLKMLFWNEEKTMVNAEQLSAVLTEKSLITFQEQPGDVFNPIRVRISQKSGRIRKRGPAYLLYTVLDSVFENYLSIVEAVGERIEALEDDILDNPTADTLEELNTYRREMGYMRKAVKPAREATIKLRRADSDFITEELTPFLRDLSDIADHAADSIDIYRDMLADHMNSYNMAAANKLNDVMKFLTMFATIFIPLSFLAGVYGMNFEFIPELHYRYGYFILLGAMASIVAVMLIYFRKRKWL